MTFTTLSAWGVRPVTAAALTTRDTAITEIRPLFARKTSDETVNNSTTLQDDNELFVSVAANQVYKLHLMVGYSSGTTPDFKINFSLPSGATMPRSSFITGGTGAAVQHGTFTGASVVGIDGQGSDASLQIWGTVVMGSTAGTVTLQWAQNTLNASDTIVRSGSTLELRLVA